MAFVAFLQILVCVLILIWMLKRKTGNAFSRKAIAKYLLFGAISLVIVLVLGAFSIQKDTFFHLNPVLCGFLTAFLTAALPEEASKYILFRLSLVHDKEAVNWHDVILVCIMIGMGFTFAEGLEFAAVGGANIIRAFIPAHLLFQAVMGYYYGKARVTKKAGWHVMSFGIPLLLHTLFDMFIIGLISIVGEDPANLTEEAMKAGPYAGYIIPMTAAIIIVAVLTVVALILVLRKIAVWSKTGEKQELLREN